MSFVAIQTRVFVVLILYWMTPTEINASSCNELFLFYFNSFSIESTKLAKVPFLHRHNLPLIPINRIFVWMNFFLILYSVMLTKFNINILIFENILFHWVIGFLPLKDVCLFCVLQTLTDKADVNEIFTLYFMKCLLYCTIYHDIQCKPLLFGNQIDVL